MKKIPYGDTFPNYIIQYTFGNIHCKEKNDEKFMYSVALWKEHRRDWAEVKPRGCEIAADDKETNCVRNTEKLYKMSKKIKKFLDLRKK